MYEALATLPVLSTQSQLDAILEFVSGAGPAAGAPSVVRARLLARLAHEVDWVQAHEPGLCTMLSARG